MLYTDERLHLQDASFDGAVFKAVRLDFQKCKIVSEESWCHTMSDVIYGLHVHMQISVVPFPQVSELRSLST
jgi:hypothetical protein